MLEGTQSRKILHHFCQSLYDSNKAVVIQFLRSIFRFMIEPIPKVRRVGDHKSGITFLPETHMIGSACIGNKPWSNQPLRWESHASAK